MSLDKNGIANKKVADLVKKFLTRMERPVKLLKHCYGEMSEWFKELVLKTSDSERGRGFESHFLRSNFIKKLYISLEKYPRG